MHFLKILSTLALFALTLAPLANAGGGMTGGGGTSDEVCYYITPDNTLTLNEVSQNKLCAPPIDMMSICEKLAGPSQDCTGIDAERLRSVLQKLL